MLEVRGLTTPVLAPASFTLRQGECVAVRGPSGAGKTVLLRAIADLDPNSGEVLLDGVRRGAMPVPAWRRKVRFLAAEPGWWDDTVAPHFSDWEQARPLVERLLLPPGIEAAPLARLSTGERQRLALVRALVDRPQVLLADEPTAALDAAAVEAVEGWLAELRGQGMAILWVTHDEAQAARVADRCLEISAGRVAEVGP